MINVMDKGDKNNDKDNNEFEVEADAAFENALKNKANSGANEDDDDEFADAFNAAENSAPNKKAITENKDHTSAVKSHVHERQSSKKDSFEVTKELGAKNATETLPSNDLDDSSIKSGEQRHLPPLPEFALELITRQKSQSGDQNDILSPTHSIRSAPSSESSERGWSSDPDTFRIKPQQSLEEAKQEWNQVETVTAGSSSGVAKSPMVSFAEAIFHFRSANLDEYAASIKPTIKYSGLRAIWHAFTGPPKILDRLKDDRDLIFTLALCPFDNLEAMHVMILQTIYKKLTATNLDCPRYGGHWESIGFQGMDPATDLRGCGMLGLLTTLHLVSSQETHNLAIDIYRLSEDEIQNFPFCIMAINITRMTLQIFREGKLNKECNRRGQVFEVFNELFCSIYHQVYRIWKYQNKTISDSGFVIKEVETAAKHNPMLLIKNYQKAMSERKKTKVPVDDASPSKHGANPIGRIDKFAGVCDINSQEEEVHLV